MSTLIPTDQLHKKIYLIRGQKVMLDRDLASLYGVPTGRLNEQVKRNKARFPHDFMFQLTLKESTNLKSQFAISRWGGSRFRPYAFTEQGVAMLSTVLNSERAIHVNIAIMRAFVKLRELVATHKKMAEKLSRLERKVGEHDEQIRSVFEAIYELMSPKRIGFKT